MDQLHRTKKEPDTSRGVRSFTLQGAYASSDMMFAVIRPPAVPMT